MNINEKFNKTKRPIKILQFGEGNFLRCFVDWIVSNMNDNPKINFNSNIAVVQPLPVGMIEGLKSQDGLYTVLLEGIMNGKTVEEEKVIDVLDDFINPYTEYNKYLEYAKSKDLEYIISNTTEAGIVYDESDTIYQECPKTFPGKLLILLKNRYDYFLGDNEAGLDIITCELIDHNGDELKKVLVKLAQTWNLSEHFIKWLVGANCFYNTLVDRIVPGYPRNQVEELREKLGYVDNFMVKGEIFHLWVIEDHHFLSKKFPANRILNVLFVDDVTLYKVRKVKILNGSHTLMVPVSYLAGHNTVLETMKDPTLLSFVKGYIFDEVIPTIDLPKDDMNKFACSVLERYLNPFIRHELMSIALNSITKYKTRILDTIIKNIKMNKMPKNALYSLASLIVFYRGKRFIKDNDVIIEEKININDNPEFLELFNQLWHDFDEGKITSDELVISVLSLSNHWEYDFTLNHELVEFVQKAVKEILAHGVINEFFKTELHFKK